MDLSNLSLFNGLIGKMDWLKQRQGLIATNIADADTPGVEGRDLAPFTFNSLLKKLQPVTTNAAHLQMVSAGGDTRATSQIHNAYEVKPDGNAISTEVEMKKAADTAADYQLAANVYKKSVGIIELALGNGKG